MTTKALLAAAILCLSDPTYGQDQDCVVSTHELWLYAPGTRVIEAEAFLVSHFTGLGYVDDQGRLLHPDFECYIALPIRRGQVGIVPYFPADKVATSAEVVSNIKDALYRAFSEADESFLIVERAVLSGGN